VTGVVGRPRRRPDMLFADRGYDHDKYRRLLRQRGIRPAIAERGQPHGTGLGTFRWRVVERMISWLHGFRRLHIRWERRDDIHEALYAAAERVLKHTSAHGLFLVPCGELEQWVRNVPSGNKARWLADVFNGPERWYQKPTTELQDFCQQIRSYLDQAHQS
jgi:transposase